MTTTLNNLTAEKKIKEITRVIKEEKRNPESDHLEIKKEWKKLKDNGQDETDKLNRSEFLGDLIGLINSPNNINKDVELILIYGIDEITGQDLNSPLIATGLKDQTELQDLIKSFVVPSFDIALDEIKLESGNTVAFITVNKTSINRPHIIKEHWFKTKEGKIFCRQNYIPVKKSTSIFPASRNDLDRIYKVQSGGNVNNSLLIRGKKQRIIINYPSQGHARFSLQVILENSSDRNIVIKDSTLTMHKLPGYEINTPVSFHYEGYSYENEDRTSVKHPKKYEDLIIPPDDCLKVYLHYLGSPNSKKFFEGRDGVKFGFTLDLMDDYDETLTVDLVRD